MQFSYSLTREEFQTANAKYFKKATSYLFVMAILAASFFVISVVMYFVNRFVTHNADAQDLTSFLALFFGMIALMYFAFLFGNRRTSKSANEEYFNIYNVDGALCYCVELTETELIIKLNQNVSHLPLKSLSKVTDVDGCSFALFKTNTILPVKHGEDTAQLIQSLKSVAAVQK